MLPSYPLAVVLSCSGAPDGDLNVVRSLGREGIPVAVVCEYPNPPSRASRYCCHFQRAPRFTHEPDAVCEHLIDLARTQDSKPVLFPTADPDLMFVAARRAQLEPWYHIPLAATELVADLTDKRRFARLADKHVFPVPTSVLPAETDDLEAAVAALKFPVVIKPAHPAAWKDDRIAALVHSHKAHRTDNPRELLQLYARIAQYGGESFFQEYIPGPDPEHYELHVYLDRESVPRAWFTGQKVRLYPVHAGSGCYVRSVALPDLAAIGIEALRRLRFTGIANVDFKRDMRSGEYKLLEVNPRVSQWNILATACGINIPLIAYADILDWPRTTEPRQQEGIDYLNLQNDRRAFVAYRRAGEWSLLPYLRSLLRGPKVYQYLSGDDLRPFFVQFGTRLLARAQRLIHAGRRRATGGNRN